MVVLSHVKCILVVALLALAIPLRAEDPQPNPTELLKSVRIAQSSQSWKLTGRLRVSSKRYPFRLTMDPGVIRYEFTDTGNIITLRLGEKSSTLEETIGGKTGRVTPAKFDTRVQGTDISYEDLALRFLYWPGAKIIGSDIIAARRCWKVEVFPPNAAESQYARVVLWIGKDDNALMKAESYDAAGKWARRFTVISVMKREGYWLLQQMRIESSKGGYADSKPTYLEIQDAEK